MVSELAERIERATAAVRERSKLVPRAGIILGTGLGRLAEEIKEEASISYSDIPGFPAPTVETHAGTFILGTIEGVPVAGLAGRYHYYEGLSLDEVTLPVRVVKALGAEALIISGAAGGMNPQHSKGDILIIEDHINLMGVNPLIGPNDDTIGPRYPDMCEPYDSKLIELAVQAALEEKVVAHTGVYVGVTGPNLETRAEYRMLRMMGADVVGMSTVPEVIVAVHSGLRVLGLSVITDECYPDSLTPGNIEKIITVATEAEPKLTAIVKRVLRADW